ncbi:hypothetical protein BGW38_010484 [Lunasporangiospora selenospora]|uniref:Uncharacterized protein n=1 Tax=Lunasporangiospora selenospora TaxID=979761 RepID=A0A9P6FYG6_9FUNG|nr:hypothetical protein BGW38_010484 [Lunasporangiospora selenospora]
MIIHQQGPQRLPNEVLLQVIKCFADDLPQLHTFLSVNWIFFDAASRLLYSRPVTLLDPESEMLFRPAVDYSNALFARHSKLASLLLNAILQNAGDNLDELFETNGLIPIRRIMDPFLEICFQAGTDPNDKNKSPTPKPNWRLTRNYSRYLESSPSISIFNNWVALVQPIDIPSNARGSPSAIGRFIHNRIHILFLSLNAPHIRRLEVGLDLVSEIVNHGLHLQMSSLETLAVRFDFLWDDACSSHEKRLCTFIRGNQSAFPSKDPLDVLLDEDFDLTAPIEPSFDQKLEIGLDDWGLKGTLGFYAAMESPRRIGACKAIWFYERIPLTKISLGKLQVFKDTLDRVGCLEGGDQLRGNARAVATKVRSFLKQCPQLQDLALFVSHIDQFDFREGQKGITYRKDIGTSSTGPTHSPVCPRLSKLTLMTSRYYKVLVGALNDAISEFGSSLTTVSATIPVRWMDTRLPSEIHDSCPIDYRHTARCNAIGYWSAPFLRTIDINLSGMPSLDVGDFSGCPQLETLRICFHIEGGVSNSSDSPLDVPQGPELPDWLDPFKLFPKWTLPKLRELRLTNMAALRFNFESFEDGMPNLMTARLIAQETQSIVPNFVYRVPRLSKHVGSNSIGSMVGPLIPNLESQQEPPCSHQPKEEFHQGQHIQPDTSKMWTERWHLPKLRELELLGPSACVFTRDRFMDLPMLRSLKLGCNELLGQRITKKVIGKHFDTPLYGSDEGIIASPWIDRPFLESKLETVSIRGILGMTEDSISRILTLYAPNLRILTIEERRESCHLKKLIGLIKGMTRMGRYGRGVWTSEQESVEPTVPKLELSSLELEMDRRWESRLGLKASGEKASESTESEVVDRQPGDRLHKVYFFTPYPLTTDDEKLVVRHILEMRRGSRLDAVDLKINGGTYD